MTNPHPKPDQLDFQYETALLAEECGEVTQIIGKSLRFGWTSYHPDDPSVSNLDLLHTEVGDVLAAVELAKVRGLLDASRLEDRKHEKFVKLLAIAPQAPIPVTPAASPQPETPATIITQETTVSTKVDTGLTAAQEKAAAAISLVFVVALLVAAWMISASMARESFRLEAAQAAAQCYQDAVTMNVSATTCEALKKLSGVPSNDSTGN